MWSPNSEQLKDHIETVQENAAKFVLNKYPKKGHWEDFSSSALVEELGWDTLEWRRIKSRCVMAYKIIKNDTLLPSDSLSKESDDGPRRPNRTCQEPTVGWENKLQVPTTKTLAYEESFFVNTPELWNRYVTSDMATSSLDTFKSKF